MSPPHLGGTLACPDMPRLFMLSLLAFLYSDVKVDVNRAQVGRISPIRFNTTFWHFHALVSMSPLLDLIGSFFGHLKSRMTKVD